MTVILTYNTPHRKTTEVINGLILNDEEISSIYTVPFLPRTTRKPLFNHRPNQSVGAHPNDIANYYNINYTALNDINDFPHTNDIVLVMVGIVPKYVVENNKIINCHPGLIPTIRGLDAFKWAIYDKKPLGVTLHFIDKEVDAGEHVFSMRTPVFASDTLESLSLRHYMNELHILINYKKYLNNRNKPLFPENIGKAHVRMSAEKEKIMLDAFPEYIYEFSKQKRELS